MFIETWFSNCYLHIKEEVVDVCTSEHLRAPIIAVGVSKDTSLLTIYGTWQCNGRQWLGYAHTRHLANHCSYSYMLLEAQHSIASYVESLLDSIVDCAVPKKQQTLIRLTCGGYTENRHCNFDVFLQGPRDDAYKIQQLTSRVKGPQCLGSVRWTHIIKIEISYNWHD